jgi:hypothetical protein
MHIKILHVRWRRVVDSKLRAFSDTCPTDIMLFYRRKCLIPFRKAEGTRKRSWLRHYATSRKVAGSIIDEVDFLNLPNPSSRTMALGSIQSLTEMSNRNLPGG